MKTNGKDTPKEGLASAAYALSSAVDGKIDESGLEPMADEVDPSLVNGVVDTAGKDDTGTDDVINGDTPPVTSPPQFDVANVNPNDFIKEKIETYRDQKIDDAFYVTNLKVIEAKYDEWTAELPRVKPYYEVRCNNDPVILYLLNDEGVGFACASKGEMDQLLGLGVSPSSIFFTNACKLPSTIRHAAQVGVNTMMFDNKCELHKIKDNFPEARLVLEIKPSDTGDMSLLEHHYGCSMDDVEEVLTEAKGLELNVIGISFQVSGVQGDSKKYLEGLDQAKNAMAIGTKLGFKFELIDIGGGFPGESDSANMFKEITTTLRKYIDKNFPKKKNIQICAEPGVFLVNSAYKLVANVIGKRAQKDSKLTESKPETEKDEVEEEMPEDEPPKDAGNPPADSSDVAGDDGVPDTNGDNGGDSDEETIEPADNTEDPPGPVAETAITEGTKPTNADNESDESNKPDNMSYIYYINDGLFGPTPPHIPQSAIEILEMTDEAVPEVYPTSIWDQTATNGQSCTQPGVVLPELDVGDWVVFADCGTYTFVTVSNFTSPQKAGMFYVSWEETPSTDTPKKRRKSKDCVIL